MYRRNLDLDLIKEIKNIETLTSKFTGISINLIESKNRKADIILAKFLTYLYCRKIGISYPRIAQYFKIDHTSVMHAVKATQEKRFVLSLFEKFLKDNKVTLKKIK